MITKTAGYNLMLNWTKTLASPNMMSLTECALTGKYKLSLHFHKSKLLCFQVPIRKVRAISTVWNVTITAPTPTRWWRTEGSIRSWTASWLRASRSSPPPSTAPPPAAVTTGSRLITTAESVNMLFSVCRRWRLINTDTWTNSWSSGLALSLQWSAGRRAEAGYVILWPAGTCGVSRNVGNFARAVTSWWGQNSI